MASLICQILRLGSLSTIFTHSQSMLWFSVVTWSVRADLLMVDNNLFFPLLVFFSFLLLSTSFLCSFSHGLSSLPVSPMYSAPQFLHGIWYTNSLCSSSSTLSLGCTNRHLRVVWGRMTVATPYFFSTRCTLSETPSTYGMTTWLLQFMSFVFCCSFSSYCYRLTPVHKGSDNS